jgi:hypothetical protein
LWTDTLFAKRRSPYGPPWARKDLLSAYECSRRNEEFFSFSESRLELRREPAIPVAARSGP